MIARVIAAPFWWMTRWIFNWHYLLAERAAYREDARRRWEWDEMLADAYAQNASFDSVRARREMQQALTNLPGQMIRLEQRLGHHQTALQAVALMEAQRHQLQMEQERMRMKYDRTSSRILGTGFGGALKLPWERIS